MRDTLKQLRPWLESWGAWRRQQLAISYPSDAVSCNPDLHIALPIPEPAFRMPSYTYDRQLSPYQNAVINVRRLRAMEKVLREYHHIKRTETKPKRTGLVPNYNPHWRMNLIDRNIAELPDKQREVITLRYEQELKTDEISYMIDRSLDAVKKRLSYAHQRLQPIPRLMVSREAPLRDTGTYVMKPRRYKNTYKRF